MKAKKKYGQNFLDSKELLEKIRIETNINNEDNIIEIGPGRGYLTDMLVNNSKDVIAFEIDDDLIPHLNNRFGIKDNFTLIQGDFLEIDLKNILNDKKYKVIANIPYYITSPIISKLFEYKNNIDSIYIMVQKEVADRITAVPHTKDMGILTHAVQFYADANYLFTVNRELFDPIPNVDSAFIEINLYKNNKYENIIDEEIYFKYIKQGFSQKRKTLVNNLSKIIDKNDIINILQEIGLNKNARAEELSIDKFIELIILLEKRKNEYS